MTTVRLSVGELRGALNGAVHSFKGIPYAEPLRGRARWLRPQPRRPWNGVLDATRYGGACTQFGGRVGPLFGSRARYFEAIAPLGDSQESDDCLMLNVWTPSVDRDARLPVMVWIHGGSFTGGVANEVYDSAHLAARGAVIVVIQYRLGPPGFLHGSGLFADGVCEDNRAFHDQMLALRWVQEHIDAFGGDPACVTLFGESAGAFAIYQLAASPLARGLFHRAIAMSGMAGTHAPAGDYHRMTRDVLAEVGVKAGDADALASLDRAQMIDLQGAVRRATFGKGDPDRYGELTRHKIPFLGAASNTEFLPRPPLAVYATGTPNNLDLMIGTCANDGGLFSLTTPLGRYVSARLFANNFRALVPGENLKAAARHYRSQFPAESPGHIWERVNHDAFYRVPTLEAARAHAAAHPRKTFHYQLDYQSVVPGLGAIHAIDVALLFRSARVAQLLHDDDETRALADTMADAWAAFAKTGKPQVKALPEWEPFAASNDATLVLDRKSHMEHGLDRKLLSYWRKP